MIILAAVTSSTVSQVLLDEKAAFTVPPYELRSAAGVSSLYHLQDLLFSVGSSCPQSSLYLHTEGPVGFPVEEALVVFV